MRHDWERRRLVGWDHMAQPGRMCHGCSAGCKVAGCGMLGTEAVGMAAREESTHHWWLNTVCSSMDQKYMERRERTRTDSKCWELRSVASEGDHEHSQWWMEDWLAVRSSSWRQFTAEALVGRTLNGDGAVDHGEMRQCRKHGSNLGMSTDLRALVCAGNSKGCKNTGALNAGRLDKSAFSHNSHGIVMAIEEAAQALAFVTKAAVDSLSVSSLQPVERGDECRVNRLAHVCVCREDRRMLIQTLRCEWGNCKNGFSILSEPRTGEGTVRCDETTPTCAHASRGGSTRPWWIWPFVLMVAGLHAHHQSSLQGTDCANLSTNPLRQWQRREMIRMQQLHRECRKQTLSDC